MAYIRYVNNLNGVVYTSVVEGIHTGNTIRQKYMAKLGVSLNVKKVFIKHGAGHILVLAAKQLLTGINGTTSAQSGYPSSRKADSGFWRFLCV